MVRGIGEEGVRRNIPVTVSKEQVSHSSEKNDILLAASIDNRVAWVNDQVKLPFRIVEGERCDLGIFFSEGPVIPDALPVQTLRAHSRSGTLPDNFEIKDSAGRVFYKINIKGMGGSTYATGSPEVVPLGARSGLSTAPYGICNWGYAERDRKETERFLQLGLRTHRVAAILELKELITSEGEYVSIPEAKERGLLDDDDEPVIQIRLFRTHARIENARDEEFGFLKEAMLLVARELGKSPEEFSVNDYLQWFAHTLGEQVAIMHSLKRRHGYLTEHNITLDCSLTDFDSVGKLPKTKTELKARGKIELRGAWDSFENLYAACYSFIKSARQPHESLTPKKELQTLFFKRYREHLANRRLSEHLKTWIKKKEKGK